MKLINPRTRKDFTGLAVPRKKTFPESVEYLSIFSHGLKYLAKFRLSPTETAVLLEMLSRLEFENWIRVSQQTIGEDLGLKKQSVSIAVKKLIKLGIIEKAEDPSDRRRLIYRFNPSLGWRGEPKEWFEYAAKKDLEPTPPCFVRKK